MHTGLLYQNYGIVRNIQVNLTESNNVDNVNMALLGYITWPSGTIENFVINMESPIYGANELFAVCRYNRGLIKNGYVYGCNIEATGDLAEGQTRNAAIITNQNYVNGYSKNIYSLASVNVKKQTGVSNKMSNGVITVASGSKMLNTYSVGYGKYDNGEDINDVNSGPNAWTSNATREQNCYYIADKVFKNSYSTKANILALWDSNFQRQVLNDEGAFIIDELVAQGYYPHVNMPSVMPRQEYINLPEIKDSDLADILSTEVIEKNEEEATILCNIHNPSGEEIVDIKVEYLDGDILSQEYNEGVSKVILKLSNPEKYVSKYSVKSITTRGVFNTTYTRNYVENEKFINIEFFKKVYDVNDWKKIDDSPYENYILMNDIDFKNNHYDEITIYNAFYGKLEGNGKLIRNIKIDKSLIRDLYGSVSNLNIENIDINGDIVYPGIIRITRANSNIENIHVRTANIKSTKEENAIYAAGLISYANTETNIQNCTLDDVNIEINSGTNVIVGGIVGILSTSKIYNSCVTNLNISVNGADTTNGIGGVVGNISGDSVIQDCYAHGEISSSMQSVGGIVGMSRNGYIMNCYSAVQVQSDIGYVGGIVGSQIKDSDREKSSGNIALGGIYCNVNSEYFHRINGSGSEADGINYAYIGQKINGIKSDETDNAILLTKEQLKDPNTYITTIGWEESYDYSQVANGILPKLYYKGTSTLLPNQKDIYIDNSEELSVAEIRFEHKTTYVDATLVVNNPDQLEITGIVIDDMTHEIISIEKEENDPSKTHIRFNATPSKFYDSYKISKIKYKVNGEEKEHNIETKLDAIFYKEISKIEDWQEYIEKAVGTYQNYRLTNDLDFKGQNVKTGLTIGRLETSGDGIEYTLSNINVSIDEVNSGFIEEITTEMKNIKFENIEINYTGETTGNNFGLIGKVTAKMKNIKFNKVKINGTSKLSYVGIIGIANYTDVQNIDMTEIKVNGASYIGGLFGKISEVKLYDIYAEGITVNGTNYIGGIAGYKTYTSGSQVTLDKIDVKDISIKGSSYVGGVFGYGLAKNITVSTKVMEKNKIEGINYIGGVAGATTNYEPGSSIIVKNTEITGSGKYIGGILGRQNYGTVNAVEVNNCNINGTGAGSDYVGGIDGFVTGRIYNAAVVNCNIVTKGSYVGGVAGKYEATNNSNFNFVQGTTIQGYSRVGGLIGDYKKGNIYNSYVNATITATQSNAGGIIGYLNNIGMTSVNNTSKIYNSYVVGSTITSKLNAGGVIGDSTEQLLAGFYYNILIEANIEATDGGQTASFGLGGGYSTNNFTNTYVYNESTINGKQINNQNNTFITVTLSELKTPEFYKNKLMWSSSYYDFSALNENKYPKISKGSNSSNNQVGINLPKGSDDSQGETNLIAEELPQVAAYSLRANKLNIDLSSVSPGTTLTYGTDGMDEETIDVTQRTYTFTYDYNSPITLTLENNTEKETIQINPEDVRNPVTVNSNTIAYLEGSTLIINGQVVQENCKNVVAGEALLGSGEIYNIAENTIAESEPTKLALVETEPKEVYDYKGNKIETYGTYSVVNGKETEAIFTVNNQTLSVTDGKLENIQASKIVDSYNGKEYETILGRDGRMYDLKDEIKYPDDFKNEGIKTLAQDANNEERIVLAYYENGKVVAFNYMTGEKAYESSTEDKGLWDYLKDKWKNNDKNDIQESYSLSKNVEEKLEQRPLEAETGKYSTYITVYNSETNTHEIYKEEEALNLSSENAKSETAKISEDDELKEYYLEAKGNKIIIKQGFYFVIASITGVIISLVILRKITLRNKRK